MTRNKKYLFISAVLITVIIDAVFLSRNNTDINIKRPGNINIMIIVIDALRADHLGCYGYERNTSPSIDKLAREGVRFTQAISAGGWTVESVPSILTGTYAPTHQIQDWNSLRNSQIGTLAEKLSAKGYRCVFWSNCGPLKKIDVKDGFYRVYALEKYNDNVHKPVLTDYEFTSRIINRIKKEYKNRPFFFYIHYEGCHAPYRPPSPYKYMYVHDKYRKGPKTVPISTADSGYQAYDGEKLIPAIVNENNITDPDYYVSQYDAAVSYVDAQVQRLMDSLSAFGLDRNTLVILTADHGELLGEHDIYFTHCGTFEEVIRVPLIIRLPRIFPKNETISRQVSLVDIAPSIMEAAGLKKPAYMQGESLLAFFRSPVDYYSRYVFSSTRRESALRSEKWKIVYNGDTEVWSLYDLKCDPQAYHNLAIAMPFRLQGLKQDFDNFAKYIIASVPPEKGAPLTEEEKWHLRNFGYMQ